MKKIKYIILPLVLLVIIIVACSSTNTNSINQNDEVGVLEDKPKQSINMFVSHGHCSLPFTGKVDNLDIVLSTREDQGNPLEDMQISFEIDPNTFIVCKGDDLTDRIKTPGLFINDQNDKMIFKSTQVYTMGIDWYQVNGNLSIKGVNKPVKFFVSGIRDPKESKSTAIIIEGQLNLFDWDIDYDKIVDGKSDSVPNKWMHLNMKVNL